MKITANIATFGERKETLKKTIASLQNQVDDIRIYDNEILNDLKDNGKYAHLDVLVEDEYYFTCDDDIIYPVDYVERTLEAIRTYGMIITYHGRILKGTGLNYYKSHNCFRAFDNVSQGMLIDVCGTGVTAFDTRYFHPKELANHPLKKMCDLTFSLEAAKQGKKIGLMPHPQGWIKPIHHKGSTIFDSERNNCLEQNKLADEIYRINHG